MLVSFLDLKQDCNVIFVPSDIQLYGLERSGACRGQRHFTIHTNKLWTRLNKDIFFFIISIPVNNLPLGARKPQRFTNIYNEQYN
jgi:hypothetical protein